MEIYIIKKTNGVKTGVCVQKVTPRGEREYSDILYGGGGIFYNQDILYKLTNIECERLQSFGVDFEKQDEMLMNIIKRLQ